jgi:hypothetical protein
MRSNLTRTALFAGVLGLAGVINFGSVEVGAGESDGISPWVPVVVLNREGDFPAELEVKVVEIVSEALSRASLRATANDVYGSELVPASDSGGPLSSVTRTVMELDESLRRAVANDLADDLAALPAGQELMFGIQFGYLPRKIFEAPMPESSALKRLGPVLGLIRNSRSIMQLAANPETAATVESVAEFSPIVVMADDIPGGANLEALEKDVYEWLADGTQEQWVPMRVDFDIEVSQSGMNLLFMSFIKPGQAWKEVNRRISALTINHLKYQPPFFSDAPGLLHVRMDRQYGLTYVPQSRDPMKLRIRFGSLQSRTFLQCRGSTCADDVNKIPTIQARMTASSGMFPHSVADFMARVLGPMTTINILLREIPLDISNPAGPRVIQQGSSVPIVVKVSSGLGHESQIVIDEDTSVLGFNVYERLVGSQVTDGLTEDVRRTVRDLDADASGQLRQSLQPFADLFRQN